MRKITMLSLLLLMLPGTQTAEPLTDEASAKRIAKQVVDAIPLGDYRTELLRSLDGARLTGLKDTSGSPWLESQQIRVVFWRTDSAVHAVSLRPPSVPYSGASVSLSAAETVAKKCGAAILPRFTEWSAALETATDEVYTILATPSYNGIETRELVRVNVRRADGLPLDIDRLSPTMDYSVFAGQRFISRDAALQIGLDSYSRYQPFASWTVASVRLVLGSPLASSGPGTASTAVDRSYIERKVALPLYWIIVSNGASSMDVQHIFVHAVEGRTICVHELQGFGGGAIEVKLPGAETKASLPKTRKKVKLVPVSAGAGGPPESTPVVAVQIGGQYYTGRLDEAKKLVWLSDGHKWSAYRPEPLAEYERAAVTPRTFGTTKSGS